MTAEIEIELKPCPFCGDAMEFGATGQLAYDEDDKLFRIWCDGCSAEGSPQDQFADAIAAWNRRSPPERDGELVEALASVCDAIDAQIRHNPENSGISVAVKWARTQSRKVLAKHSPESK